MNDLENLTNEQLILQCLKHLLESTTSIKYGDVFGYPHNTTNDYKEKKELIKEIDKRT